MPWSGDDVLKFVLRVLSVCGTSAAILYGLVKVYGEKWLDKHFASQLEQLKHEHQQELENVKHTIQSTFSRILKVHERENEVLPKAWVMLHVAYGSPHTAEARPKSRPEFCNMSHGDVGDHLKR